MAKDDYFVIMYVVLKRLYGLLKQGQTISNNELDEIGSQFNRKYWKYILLNMSENGYITGVREMNTLGSEAIGYRDVQITPAGIEYLFSNSMMERVKNTMKDFKNMIPGI